MILFCKYAEFCIIQALSGDFKYASGKMHTKILSDVQWCAMCISLFLKFYNYIKGIMYMYIVFLKNLRQTCLF